MRDHLRTGGQLSPCWAQALTDYRTELRSAGLLPSSIRLRMYQLGKLARGLNAEPWDVTRADVLAWWAEQDWAPESRKSNRAAVIGFYTWATAVGHCDGSWARGLRGVRVPPAAPKPTPEGVLLDLLDATTGATRLMVILGAMCGLRADEIARVNADDVTPTGLRVKGKGGRVRVIPLTSPVRHALEDHIAENDIPPDGWIFPGGRGREGSPMLGASVASRLAKVLPGHLTAHSLRHRFATATYKGTSDLRAVQTLMGHAKPETTARYIQLADDALIRAAHAAIPWTS